MVSKGISFISRLQRKILVILMQINKKKTKT